MRADQIGPYGWEKEAERQNHAVFERDMEIVKLRERIAELEGRNVPAPPFAEVFDQFVSDNILPFLSGIIAAVIVFFLAA